MKLFKVFGHLVIITLLTILTQIGGLVWILGFLFSMRYKKNILIVFPLLYLAFNLLIIPPTAILFGRERLPITSKNLKARNWIYPLLNRNYVTPELKEILINTTNDLGKEGIKITYLDANFPFINGFPLLPHLSHNDGKKIDISFMYLDENSKATDKKPSISGYGVYVKDKNFVSESCIKEGYWQYDFTKYLTFGTIKNLSFDKRATKKVIETLLSHSQTQKIFIEPYLKESLGFSNQSKIRFHGCQAVRHDDHIHLQIK